MKQAEHPPATAGASIAAEYSLALIDQLARIDRSRSKEEMDELVYRLLSLCRRAPRQRAGEPTHVDAAGRKAEVARAEFVGREA